MSSAFYIFKEFLILSFYLVIDLSDLSRLGGFQYISALKKAFPHVSMVASQGIKIGSFAVFLLGYVVSDIKPKGHHL